MALSVYDLETYGIVLAVCHKYKVDIIDHYDFFDKLLAEYKGEADAESLSNWLDVEIPKQFKVLAERPKWIQSSAWPFHEGIPMMFVGQIDRDSSNGRFHDATSFYLFMPQGRWSDYDLVVISQQY